MPGPGNHILGIGKPNGPSSAQRRSWIATSALIWRAGPQPTRQGAQVVQNCAAAPLANEEGKAVEANSCQEGLGGGTPTSMAAADIRCAAPADQGSFRPVGMPSWLEAKRSAIQGASIALSAERQAFAVFY